VRYSNDLQYLPITAIARASHGHGYLHSLRHHSRSAARASPEHRPWMGHGGLTAISLSLAAARASGDWRCRRLLGLEGCWCCAVAALDWRMDAECGMSLTQGRGQDGHHSSSTNTRERERERRCERGRREDERREKVSVTAASEAIRYLCRQPRSRCGIVGLHRSHCQRPLADRHQISVSQPWSQVGCTYRHMSHAPPLQYRTIESSM
jgi:hypothetical protein